MTTNIDLATLQPDFDGMKSRLTTLLSQRASWAGLLPTQTGTTLIDMIATAAASARMATIRAKQDAFPETAASERALYANADAQGIRISRKLPASIQVTMRYDQPDGYHPDSITIPQFTQLQGAGTYWYTRQSYVLPSGSGIQATLYQGYVVSQTTGGRGTDYQTFISVEKDFSVADTDVFVFINGTQALVTPDGLWNHKGISAVQDRTTSDGRLMLLFGNSAYGARPTANDEVRIVYAVTSGYDGNSVAVLNQRINPVNAVSGLSVTVTSAAPAGGANQPSATQFKTVAATAFGTMSAAVTPRQYQAVALEYPGIKDVRFYAQRDLNTADVRFMNAIRAVPLFAAQNPASQAMKDAFVAYMQERTMFAPYIYVVDPTPVARDVSLRLNCYSWATLSACEADAAAAIRALFTPRAGYIGYNITVSDIVRVALGSNAGIEYVEVLQPTTDLTISGDAAPAPSLLLFNGATSLTQAVHSYAIGVTDANGVILPRNFATVQVPQASTFGVRLSWDSYANATSYQVYGRIGGAIGLIASLPATQRTYDDVGAAVGAAPPVSSSYPVLYNTLNALSVKSVYSMRSRAQ